MDLLVYIAIAVVIHIFILYIVNRKKFLTWPDGIIIAGISSFLIFLASHIYWIMLFTFFIPASILSKAKQERKKNKIIIEKSSQRNAYQVLSNSFGLILFSILQLVVVGIDGNVKFSLLIPGTLFVASASADTWSTEIGTLNKSDPRYILDLRKKVPRGTSGGVSTVGTLGALLGSLLITTTLVGILIVEGILTDNEDALILFIILTALGFSGSIIDSILGATLQKKYDCPVCQLEVEENNHPTCKTRNLIKKRKITFLNNNTVNLTSNLLISILGLVLIILIHFNPF